MCLFVSRGAQHNMHLLEILFATVADLGMRNGGWPFLERQSAGHFAEFLQRQIHSARVLQMTRRGDEQVVGSVMIAEISEQEFAIKAAHRLASAQNGSA